MRSPSLRDMENLSAYLDGQISPSARTRLEKRIQSNADLAAALEEIRQTRRLLSHTPQRHAPRNFTLTPRMAGIRPPVPRIVPVFSWASAVAMVVFMITLGTSLVGRLSFGAAAPMLSSAPGGFGGGPPAAATQAPAIAAPAIAPTGTPVPLRTNDQSVQKTPSAEAFAMPVPETSSQPETGNGQPPAASKTQEKPLTPWLLIWLGLGVLLGILALVVLWLNQRAFRQKNRRR